MDMQDEDDGNMHMESGTWLWGQGQRGRRQGAMQETRRAEGGHEPDAGECGGRVLVKSKQSKQRERRGCAYAAANHVTVQKE